MLNWLYTAISWILLRWHDLFSKIGMDSDSGLTWALSITFLVITIRVLLFRFFVKQVRTQRKMQELQPQISKIREKYKSDRQAMSREVMKLQQEAGVNPLAGCLPILLQAPVFLSLFHVLRRLQPGRDNLYGWTEEQMESASNAKLFGAPISATFRTSAETLDKLGASSGTVKVVTSVMVLLMVAATYITQRQIMARSTTPLEGQQAMIQKMMLYGLPASLLISGFFFPLGVLCYWLTNNLWTMGQQFYILKRMPPKGAPGTEAKKPKVDPKVLAPKPGAKPVHPKSRRTESAAAPAEPAGDAEPEPADEQPRTQPANRSGSGRGPGSGGAARGGTSRPAPGKRPAGSRTKKKRR